MSTYTYGSGMSSAGDDGSDYGSSKSASSVCGFYWVITHWSGNDPNILDVLGPDHRPADWEYIKRHTNTEGFYDYYEFDFYAGCSPWKKGDKFETHPGTGRPIRILADGYGQDELDAAISTYKLSPTTVNVDCC